MKTKVLGFNTLQRPERSPESRTGHEVLSLFRERSPCAHPTHRPGGQSRRL